MNFKKIGKVLARNGLKLLGKTLPIGGNVVSDLICNTLGLSNENDIEKALKNPENILKLKQLEINNELELIRLENEDLANTRSKAISDNQSNDKFIRRFDEYLALMVVVLSFVFMFTILYIGLEGGNRDIAMILLGYVSNYPNDVLKFYFGNSKKTQKEKRDI